MFPSYATILAEAKEFGEEIPSRHGPTRERLDLMVMSHPGEMLRRDNINYNIGYVEALAMIAGTYETEALHLLAPNSQHVLFTINMAYGPRVTLQLPRIIEKLKADPWSRQAVVFIGKPEDGATSDQPCTTTMQFLIRGGLLRCSVRMRSWDLVKGAPYDLMMFHAVNAVLAHCLGVKPGPVCVAAASAHVYDRDAGRNAKLSTRRFELSPAMPRRFDELRTMAQDMLRGCRFWPDAEGGAKHVVPPMFYEILTGEPPKDFVKLVGDERLLPVY